MRTRTGRSTRLGATCAGSLCGGDISQIAHVVHQAAQHADITVWSDANADVLVDRADRSPDVEPQYLAGTYGIGAQLSDIESDLQVLQNERVSAAIVF